MLYVLSWSGRGFVGFLAIIGAALLGVGMGTLLGRAEILCFGVAWIGSGVACYSLGKRWNSTNPVHKFCGLRLERWGWIYMGIGAFLAFTGLQALRVGM
jgi:hypothetical protein